MKKFNAAMALIYSIFFNLAMMSEACADNVLNTQPHNSQIENSVVGTAQDWGLTTEEWSRYGKYRQRADAQWYPQLTPPEILGLHAENVKEQQHFAEMVAKQEHDKLARELAFDRAVHEALLRLYPDEQVIQPFDISPYTPIPSTALQHTHPLQAGDHVVLFENISQGVEASVLPRLVSAVRSLPGLVLDIFAVGKVDDISLRAWAVANHIPVELTTQGRITLNHDNGKLQRFSGNATLPYIVRLRQGETRIVSVESLL